MLWKNKTSKPLKSDCRNEAAGYYSKFMYQQAQELKENLKASSGEPKQVQQLGKIWDYKVIFV